MHINEKPKSLESGLVRKARALGAAAAFWLMGERALHADEAHLKPQNIPGMKEHADPEELAAIKPIEVRQHHEKYNATKQEIARKLGIENEFIAKLNAASKPRSTDINKDLQVASSEKTPDQKK